VSPEASSFAKASEDIPRSFNEGELAPGLRSRSGCFGGVGEGDNHEVCISSRKPISPRPTLCRHHRQS